MAWAVVGSFVDGHTRLSCLARRIKHGVGVIFAGSGEEFELSRDRSQHFLASYPGAAPCVLR